MYVRTDNWYSNVCVNVYVLQDTSTGSHLLLAIHPVSLLLTTQSLALLTAHKFRNFTAALTIFLMVEFFHVLDVSVVYVFI